MLRTTLMIPPALKARAQQRARELGISFGQLVRQAIEESLQTSETDRREADPLFADRAVFTEETPADLSTDHDRYLYGEDAP